MNKLGLAALGLLTRAGKSLVGLVRHESRAPAISRKKGKATRKTHRGSAGTAKLR
jgi:hypothetical protein